MMRENGQTTFREDRTTAYRDNRSLGDLFSELSRESSALIRHEIELAKIEMTQKATVYAKNSAYIAAGGAVGYLAAAVLVFGLVFLLDTFMPLWLAALIVGTVAGVIAYAMIQSGLDTLRKTPVKPEKTVRTLKEDQQWLKEQVR